MAEAPSASGDSTPLGVAAGELDGAADATGTGPPLAGALEPGLGLAATSVADGAADGPGVTTGGIGVDVEPDGRGVGDGGFGVIFGVGEGVGAWVGGAVGAGVGGAVGVGGGVAPAVTVTLSLAWVSPAPHGDAAHARTVCWPDEAFEGIWKLRIAFWPVVSAIPRATDPSHVK